MIARAWTLFALGTAMACAASRPEGAPPTPDAPTPVRISGPFGAIASTAVRNEARGVARPAAASLDSVWRALPRVYELLGIPDAAADPERQIFGNREFRVRRLERERLSRYIDCGTGITSVPQADTYSVTMSVVTRLAPAQDGWTMIETTVEATARPRDVSGNAVYCPSSGKLEARVFELVLEVLSRR